MDRQKNIKRDQEQVNFNKNDETIDQSGKPKFINIKNKRQTVQIFNRYNLNYKSKEESGDVKKYSILNNCKKKGEEDANNKNMFENILKVPIRNVDGSSCDEIKPNVNFPKEIPYPQNDAYSKKCYDTYLMNKQKCATNFLKKNSFHTISGENILHNFKNKPLDFLVSKENQRKQKKDQVNNQIEEKMDNKKQNNTVSRIKKITPHHYYNYVSKLCKYNTINGKNKLKRRPTKLKLTHSKGARMRLAKTELAKAMLAKKKAEKKKLAKMYVNNNNVFIKYLKIYKNRYNKNIVSNISNLDIISKRDILSLPDKPVYLYELDNYRFKLNKNIDTPALKVENEDINFLFKYKNTWLELFFYNNYTSKEILYNYIIIRLNFELMIQEIKDIVIMDINTKHFNYPYIYNAYLIPPINVHDIDNSLRIQKVTSDYSFINNGSWAFLRKKKKKKHINKKNHVENSSGEKNVPHLLHMTRNKYYINHNFWSRLKNNINPSRNDNIRSNNNFDSLSTMHSFNMNFSNNTHNFIKEDEKAKNENKEIFQCTENQATFLSNFQSDTGKEKNTVSDADNKSLSNYNTFVFRNDNKTKLYNDNSLIDPSNIYITFTNSKIEPFFPYMCDNIFFLFYYYNNYLKMFIKTMLENDKKKKLLMAHQHIQNIREKNKQNNGNKKESNQQNSNKTELNTIIEKTNDQENKYHLKLPIVLNKNNELPTKNISTVKGEITTTPIKITNYTFMNNLKIKNSINDKMYNSIFNKIVKKNSEKIKKELSKENVEIPIYLWVIFGGKDMKSMDSLNMVYKMLRYATEIPPGEYEKYIRKLKKKKIKINCNTNTDYNHLYSGHNYYYNEKNKKKVNLKEYNFNSNKTSNSNKIKSESNNFLFLEKLNCCSCNDRQAKIYGNHARTTIWKNDKQSGEQNKKESTQKNNENCAYGLSNARIQKKQKKRTLPELSKDLFPDNYLYNTSSEIYKRIVDYYNNYNKKYSKYGPNNYKEFLEFYNKENIESNCIRVEEKKTYSKGAIPTKGNTINTYNKENEQHLKSNTQNETLYSNLSENIYSKNIRTNDDKLPKYFVSNMYDEMQNEDKYYCTNLWDPQKGETNNTSDKHSGNINTVSDPTNINNIIDSENKEQIMHEGKDKKENNYNHPDSKTYDLFLEANDSESSDQESDNNLYNFISYHMQGRNPSFEIKDEKIKSNKLNYTDIYGPVIYRSISRDCQDEKKQKTYHNDNNRNQKNKLNHNNKKEKRKARYSFLLLDYPSYYNSTGHPSPLTFKTSAFCALKEAIKEIRKENKNASISINTLGYSLGCCVSLQLILDIAKSLYNDFYQDIYKIPYNKKEKEPIKEIKEHSKLSIKLNNNTNKINEYIYDSKKILTFENVLFLQKEEKYYSSNDIFQQDNKEKIKNIKIDGEKKENRNKLHLLESFLTDKNEQTHINDNASTTFETTNCYDSKPKVKTCFYKHIINNPNQANKMNALKLEKNKTDIERLNKNGKVYLDVTKKNENKNNGVQNYEIQTKSSLRLNVKEMNMREEIVKEKKQIDNLKITVDKVILVAPFTNTQKLVKGILNNSMLFLLSSFIMNKKCQYVHWDNIMVLKELFKIINDFKKNKYLYDIFYNFQIDYIHGEKDTLVPYNMSLILYKLTNDLIIKYSMFNIKTFLYLFKEDCHSSILNSQTENNILQIIFKPFRLHPFSTTSIHKFHFDLYKDLYLLKTVYLQYISRVTSNLRSI
ncbi:conserved Plasmodium protein, unknown function [Plasmodium chabaudi chabaudi]|uniref:Uncharacterized protein n=1 Tax=Plasmodium chabaudi chabaudi TaxID=31271 RepID=A0A4V0K8E5_PLACU|nr:conserved Plasmodium protein, unknown function [Plasmodium chabaudi chabaudi]VTZ68881.1 conserved Plasmodium protein, unknown function [Plasmodium chabaudi chabaudi]|eukprot:XP_016655414.1 conserved Plasmodium protein, unknown function [Plasmodium chabaudi chabaudi]